MSNKEHDDLLKSLMLLSQRDLIELINRALENRIVELCDPEVEEARICLVELHRYTDAPWEPVQWDLQILARAEKSDSFVTNGIGPTEEGGCCGFVIHSYSKSAVCPICGKRVGCT